MAHSMPNDVSPDPRDHKVDPDEVNARNNFSMHAVFELALPLPAEEAERAAMARELEETISELGVTVRGWYDVAGYRADADLMFWFLDESNDKLQDAYHAVLNSRLGAHLVPVWSIMSAHMTAEFNKPHLPACFGGWPRVPMPRFIPSCVPWSGITCRRLNVALCSPSMVAMVLATWM
ncbi:chlorite dismutase family protein [Varibaculum cambriense]|nr:chlorite dismutase family protein [Varibaculum cambriense]